MQATIEEKNEMLAVREINNFTLESENANLRKQLEKFNKKLQYLKDMPLGARLSKRQFKPLEEVPMLEVANGSIVSRLVGIMGSINFVSTHFSFSSLVPFLEMGELGVGGGIVKNEGER